MSGQRVGISVLDWLGVQVNSGEAASLTVQGSVFIRLGGDGTGQSAHSQQFYPRIDVSLQKLISQELGNCPASLRAK